MLNPKYLQTFVTLVETGNFTRTAESLFMTQPGVSQHLKKLEGICECELLIRLNKGILLTEQGQRLYTYAIQCRAEEAIFMEGLKFDALYEGKCIIACSGAVAQNIYPALAALQQQHDKLNIHIEVAPQQRILTAIADNSIALGIVTNEPDAELYQSEYLGEEHLNLFLPPGFSHSPPHIADELRKLGLINHPDARHYMQLYFRHCGIEDLASINLSQINEKGYVNQLSQILLPVSLGVGFTVLPASVQFQSGFANSLTVHHSPEKVTRPLFKVQSKYKKLPARYACVIEVIEKALRGNLAINLSTKAGT